LLGASVVVQAARDDSANVIAQLRAQIAALEKAPAAQTGGMEQQRNERRLGALRRELAVIEKRQEIEGREQSLRASMNAQPRAQLRERLQALATDATATDTKLGELTVRRAQATLERDALARKLAEVRRVTPPTPAAAVEATETEERIITKEEELRAIALRAEALGHESDLIRLGQTMRERLKAAEGVVARPTIRTMLAMQSLDDDDAKAATLLGVRLTNTEENLRNSETGLGLQREKLAGFDEEIRLLENRPPGQRRTPMMDQTLTSVRVQQKTVADRLPLISEQVEALRLSRDIVRAQREMLTLAGLVRNEDLGAMRGAYGERLRLPAVAIGVLVAAYLVLSALVFPRRYKKEMLFLARRVGRYLLVFLCLVVVAIASIDDLRLLATTLGVASAGVVIALQDVATSIFGWCVIMSGGKFTIGDRLEIDGARGDVLDIQLMRTTLVEVNNWLGVDQPTGRVFIVPNNFVFKSRVFNYSHGHPYTWGVVDVTVTYATPVASALALFQKVLDEETREAFAEARQAAAVMERRYGVEDADYHPKVYTRITENGVTFSLLYVCHYRHTPMMRNRINRRLIAELETHGHIRLAYPTRQLVAATENQGLPSAVLGRAETQVPFVRPGMS
jgi:small-conductance mechanosensitive channel